MVNKRSIFIKNNTLFSIIMSETTDKIIFPLKSSEMKLSNKIVFAFCELT